VADVEDTSSLSLLWGWTVRESDVLSLTGGSCVMWFLLWHEGTNTVQLVLREQSDAPEVSASTLFQTLFENQQTSARMTPTKGYRVQFSGDAFHLSDVYAPSTTDFRPNLCRILGGKPTDDVRWCLMVKKRPLDMYGEHLKSLSTL
jgi:hypothetical protein